MEFTAKEKLPHPVYHRLVSLRHAPAALKARRQRKLNTREAFNRAA